MRTIYKNVKMFLLIFLLEIKADNPDLENIIRNGCEEEKEIIRTDAHKTVEEVFGNHINEDKSIKNGNEILKPNVSNVKTDTDDYFAIIFNISIIIFTLFSFLIILFFYYKILNRIDLILK